MATIVETTAHIQAGDGRVLLRHLGAVSIGNALQYYDFFLYAFFATQIGRAFFPSDEGSTSLLAALATFGVGFLMRPLGAVMIGRFADRAGRRRAMLASFTLMGIAMIGLALTPSYDDIGLAAPLLVIVFRLIQGFALGGEMGPSTAYLVETAPPHRRGLHVSLQYVGQDAAVLAAGLVGFALSSMVSAAALDGWAWRAAFLLGAVIIPIGFRLRSDLAETLSLARIGESRIMPPALRRVRLLAFVLLAGSAVVSYVEFYLTTFVVATLKLSAQTAFLPTIAIGVTSMIFGPLGGWLSDRFGRKPVMIAPWLLLLAIGLPGFWLVVHVRTAAMLVVWAVILAACIAPAIAAMLVGIAESLPASVRCGTLGLTYAMAISVFGGSTQFAVAWLTGETSSPLAPAWYMAAAMLIVLIAMVLMPESAPAKRDAEAVRRIDLGIA